LKVALPYFLHAEKGRAWTTQAGSPLLKPPVKTKGRLSFLLPALSFYFKANKNYE
jgi:hypothetical protein